MYIYIYKKCHDFLKLLITINYMYCNLSLNFLLNYINIKIFEII